ncbi:hypothetical protein [Arsenicicoccus piscis]|uniref:hypothetical protein n=1 Tax=Arsenicicoccus piscis TaxID=673954 RepID=UPI0024E1424F|nr:hypothetical protein [Arsenicicoccus piscis]
MTLTRHPDPSLRWVVELSIPSGSTSPDPDAPPRSVQDRSDATTFAALVTSRASPPPSLP